MPQITFQEAKQFLNNITQKDKVAIIYHDDGDGFASGILFYDWCKTKKATTKQFTFSFGKWDKKTNLEKFNKIIITDIAPDGLNEINPPSNKEIFYTDHHPKNTPIPEKILAFQTSDQGYIPSSRTTGELTQLKPWLSLAGTISDAGDLYPENETFIDNLLKKYNVTLDEFKQNISSVITNTLVFFEENPSKAFKIIQKINSLEEIPKLKKYSEPIENEIGKFIKEYETKKEKINNINLYYINPKFSTKVIIINIISRENPDEILIFLSPKKSNPNILGISSRHQSSKADLPSLLKSGIKGLENANAGGHLRAAGAQIQAEDLNQFKQNLKNRKPFK